MRNCAIFCSPYRPRRIGQVKTVTPLGLEVPMPRPEAAAVLGRPQASPQGTIERALDTRLTARARAPASWPLLSACQWASWPPVDVLNPKTEASRGQKTRRQAYSPVCPEKATCLERMFHLICTRLIIVHVGNNISAKYPRRIL